MTSLVHFHHRIDFADEPKAGEETDCACWKINQSSQSSKNIYFCYALTGKKEEEEYHDERVPKIEECRRGVGDFQFGDEVMHAVKKQVKGCKSTGQEATPPPVIILRKVQQRKSYMSHSAELTQRFVQVLTSAHRWK